MKKTNTDTQRESLALIRYYFLFESLISGNTATDELRFLEATIAKQTMTLWMQERINDTPEIKSMIAERVDQRAALIDDELENIVQQGLVKFVQTHEDPPRALHGIAALICDLDRLTCFIQMLFVAGGPDWCRLRRPSDSEVSAQMVKEILGGFNDVPFDDAVEQVLNRVAWSRKGAVNGTVENRRNDDPEYHP